MSGGAGAGAGSSLFDVPEDPVVQQSRQVVKGLLGLLALVMLGFWGVGTRAVPIILGVAGGLLLLLYRYQHWLLYMPHFPPGSNSASGMLTLQDMRLPSARVSTHTVGSEPGVKLVGLMYWYEGELDGDKSTQTIIFFHGNAGNNSHRLPFAREFANACRANVYLAAYRGYGASTGTPGEQGLRRDALAQLEFVRTMEGVDPARIVLVGRSLGGAVAAWLADQRGHEISGLVLENTFTGIPDMIDAVMPVFKTFKPLVTNLWETHRFISRLKMPMLLVSSRKDEIVPPWQMRRLRELATGSSRVEWVELDASHNDTLFKPGHTAAYQGFLSRL